MPRTNKNNFASQVRHRLIDTEQTVTELAAQLKRPRETVSKAIHSKRFPRVRAAVAQALEISL